MTNSGRIRKTILISLFLFATIYHSIFLFGLRAINCQSIWVTTIISCQSTSAPLEIAFWILVLLLFISELILDHGFSSFFNECKKIWPVFIFIAFAFASLIWTIVLQATLLKIFILLATTLIAIYLGTTFELQGLVDILTAFFAILCLMNMLAVIFLPGFSIMPEEFYHRAWSGIFWHRNYLGCFMALAILVFLVRLIQWKNLRLLQKTFYSVVLLLSIFLLVKSKSATGIFTAAALLICLGIIWSWIRLENKLKKIHYFIALGIFFILGILLFASRGFIFGLLGRNISLTGRVPLWNYLLQNVVSVKPIFGYGYGAIWSLEGFRTQLQISQGWSNQVLIGDNGFIDILLHLGLIGLLILIGLIILGIIFSIKTLIHKKTIISSLPFLLLIFLIVSNISLSLILEVESFTWAVLIACFSAMSRQILKGKEINL